MRKLLVLALVVCLFPFAVGCRVDGLWGYENDDSTNTTTTVANNVVLASTVSVPTSGIDTTGGIPNLIAKNFQIVIGSSTLASQTLSLVSATTSGDRTILSFSKTVTSTALNLTATTNSRQVTVSILYNGVEIYSFLVTISGASGSATSDATNTVTITFNADPDGDDDGVLDNATTLTVSVTTPAGTTSPTAEQKTLPSFFVSQQKIWVNGAYIFLGGSQSSPTAIQTNSLNGLKFQVFFNKAATNLTANTAFSVKVDNINSTTPTGQTITSGQGEILVTPAGDKLSAELSLVNNQAVTLSNTGVYKISIVSTDLVSGTDALDTRAVAFFKTGL